jgi:hypothetical protein
MTISLLNDCMQVDIFYETEDQQFSDNICIRICETCPNEERLMLAEESNIFITPQEACTLANALLKAARSSLDA